MTDRQGGDMGMITKIDAARRQLLTAIHLHWFFVEPIAVDQLAANASEICDSILKKPAARGLNSTYQN
ncbi:hypothetical protein WGT02_28390 (plasmid) [Rhizobium sp. T1470]|uniref:hypothetical protein n=1 Tax=unclassified Rhizobium TaxID=2613769 RepID=UPI001AAF5901|nr:hypothetical protein [Rhizobium sp. T1473]MCA0805164.1 hypothetical protein [Rhizobium sp. T1473]